jgi:cadmium resistance protein CadD (predicted permease)
MVMKKEKSRVENSINGDNGSEKNNRSKNKLDRTRETVVLLTILASCSFVTGAANAILVPYLNLQNATEKTILYAVIMFVVSAPALFWFFKKYGK